MGLTLHSQIPVINYLPDHHLSFLRPLNYWFFLLLCSLKSFCSDFFFLHLSLPYFEKKKMKNLKKISEIFVIKLFYVMTYKGIWLPTFCHL